MSKITIVIDNYDDIPSVCLGNYIPNKTKSPVEKLISFFTYFWKNDNNEKSSKVLPADTFMYLEELDSPV